MQFKGCSEYGQRKPEAVNCKETSTTFLRTLGYSDGAPKAEPGPTSVTTIPARTSANAISWLEPALGGKPKSMKTLLVDALLETLTIVGVCLVFVALGFVAATAVLSAAG